MGARDARFENLSKWLRSQLGSTTYSLAPASSDASFRSYWRVTPAEGTSLIAMDAPPDKENSAAFVRVARHLAQGGVHTPRVLASDLDQGFVLLEDLGSTSYADALDPQSADALYGAALETLARIAQLSTDILDPYEPQRFDDEMELFRTWLVEAHLGVAWTTSQSKAWQAAKVLLTQSALEQPSVFVHRDYHSRNLMVCPDHNPGVLDFQDALVGPITYDPVSLLKDCYLSWPRSRVLAWFRQYQSMVSTLLPKPIEQDRWIGWFDWMGVQRHLKAAGIFSRLHLRDGKSGYLADIPRTMGYVADVCAQYSQLRELGGLLAGLPLALERSA